MSSFVSQDRVKPDNIRNRGEKLENLIDYTKEIILPPPRLHVREIFKDGVTNKVKRVKR